MSARRQGSTERPGLAHTCAGIIDGKYDPTTQARALRVHHRGADQASNGSIHSCASTFQDVPAVEREEKKTMLESRDDGMEECESAERCLCGSEKEKIVGEKNLREKRAAVGKTFLWANRDRTERTRAAHKHC